MIREAVIEYFAEIFGDDCVSAVFNRTITILLPFIKNRVWLHLDDHYLVLEQYAEMGLSGLRPKDNFLVWVDLNDETSLDVMRRAILGIQCSAASKKSLTLPELLASSSPSPKPSQTCLNG